MKHLRPINRKRSAGLTIVEILITLLVISIGLLGVAGLHSFSLRNNYDALMRSHASALASDIIDRMRANNADDKEAVYPDAGDSDYEIGLEEDAPPVEDDSSQAIRDLAEWREALAAQLPEGTGSITVEPRPPGGTGIVTVQVQWGERGFEVGDDQTETGAVTFTTQTVL